MTASVSSGLLQRAGLFDHAQKIAFLHDQMILAFDFHLGAGPFSEQDTVAGVYVERDQLPLLVARARASSDDLALLRLLFRGIGNDDAAGGPFLGIDTSHDHTVVQWTEMHEHPPLQFSDVISPAPIRPPGENDLGAAKIGFKRHAKIFGPRYAGGQTDEVGSSA